MTRIDRLLALVAATAALGGCATGPSHDDPFEPVNRAMYEKVHVPIDRDVIRPMIRAYIDIVPSPVRTAISNVFNNIDDFISAINDGLQGKPDKMGNDMGRVLINSGLGLGGLIDIASQVGVERGNEDFGQTFGVWGFPQGPYLFVPLFGPTTVRDGSGWIVRLYIGPTGYIPYVPFRNVVYGLGAVDLRYQAEDAVKLVDQASLDAYAFIRRGYLQRREYLVNDGKLPPKKEGEE